MVRRADPVPLVPHRDERVRREVVRGIRITRQEVGQTGQFTVMPLEELMELGSGDIVDCCAHGDLSPDSLPCPADGA
jgi:hypothetical protein